MGVGCSDDEDERGAGFTVLRRGVQKSYGGMSKEFEVGLGSGYKHHLNLVITSFYFSILCSHCYEGTVRYGTVRCEIEMSEKQGLPVPVHSSRKIQVPQITVLRSRYLLLPVV
jgi:hypothetical protein